MLEEARYQPLAGADRFIPDNRRDFGASITEIDVYPDTLDEP